MQEQQIADDLKFIRSMVERTQRRIDPGAPIMITWGVICLVGYPLSEWLAATGRHQWINALWLVLTLLVGTPLSALFGYRIGRRSVTAGVKSHISRQLGWVWLILVPNGVVWTLLLPRLAPHAGVVVFVSVVVAALVQYRAGMILGLAMGLGCIVPAVIALRRERRWNSEDARA